MLTLPPNWASFTGSLPALPYALETPRNLAAPRDFGYRQEAVNSRLRSLGLLLVAIACKPAARERELPPATSASSPASHRPAPSKQATARTRRPPPSIAALSHKVYIRRNPRPGSPEIGSIGLGSAVALAAEKPVSKSGCELGWYAVVPRGYVCLDPGTTLDPEHPLLRAKRGRTGDFSRGSPFAWGESREAPSYRRVPTEAEQRRFEPGLERHLERGAELARTRGRVPAFLGDHAISPWFSLHPAANDRARHGLIPTRSTVAWTDEFFAEGRSWVLSTELLVVPKDKLVPQVPSKFRGVELAWSRVGSRLPLAFIRGRDRPKYRLVGGGSGPALTPVSLNATQDAFTEDLADSAQLEPTGTTWPRLASVELTGRARRERSVRYLETREPSLWIREEDATVIATRAPEGFELQGNEKWIDVSIFRGTLVAYEGRTPVFATLISPGLKGYARQDGKPTKNTTPTGTFRIEWKHLSTTMSPNPETMSYYLSEVPYTQFFHMPFALHAAYWHDRFGEPRSGGCINLSPEDARWLFQWTTPVLPDGWHAVRSGDERGPGTWVRVR